MLANKHYCRLPTPSIASTTHLSLMADINNKYMSVKQASPVQKRHDWLVGAPIALSWKMPILEEHEKVRTCDSARDSGQVLATKRAQQWCRYAAANRREVAEVPARP